MLKRLIPFAALGLIAVGLAGCWTQEETDAKLAQAKAMAAQVAQVASAVCDVTPQVATLASAVTGMNPTVVGVATVATQICVWVKTPKTMQAAMDPCPGGLIINDVCVPIAKD